MKLKYMSVDVHFYPIIELDTLVSDKIIEIDNNEILFKGKPILYTYGSKFLKMGRFITTDVELFEFLSLMWSKYGILCGLDGAGEDAGFGAAQDSLEYGDIKINNETPYDILSNKYFPQEMLQYLTELMTDDDVNKLKKLLEKSKINYQELIKIKK